MERYDAVNPYHAWYEHWHRYHWIAPLINNKIVADLACGEGYGSALLGHQAKQVWAFDIDQKTIEQARDKYQHLDNVKFKAADVLKTPMKNSSMDAVISFETLEHLSSHSELLNEFKRVLKENGLVVISTPDKEVYSATGDHNEFHVKELTAKEFQQLICEHFDHALFFGQQFQTTSLISPQQEIEKTINTNAMFVAQGDENISAKNEIPPNYLIAVASDNNETLAPFKQLSASTFNDVKNSLFFHYQEQGDRLFETDQRLALLEQQLKQHSVVINQLLARLGL